MTGSARGEGSQATRRQPSILQSALVLLVALALLSGCAAATRQFVPAPSGSGVDAAHAIIHVKRSNILMGKGRAVTVLDDGKPIGELGPGGELTWQRPSGRLTLSLKHQVLFVAEDNPPIVADVEGGAEYTYWVRLDPSGHFALSMK